MGLDMYLHAERSFAPNSDETCAILSAAGVSLERLCELASRDPMEHGTSIYLSAWEYQRDREREEFNRSLAVFDAAGLTEFRTTESGGGDLAYKDDMVCVAITCCYWRKANAIHAWFVENAQGGIDECQESEPIDYELLAMLAKTCSSAADAYRAGKLHEAERLLQPQPGFFFGGTDLDEWWLAEADRTAEEIERLVNVACRVGGVTFTYGSSW